MRAPSSLEEIKFFRASYRVNWHLILARKKYLLKSLNQLLSGAEKILAISFSNPHFSIRRETLPYKQIKSCFKYCWRACRALTISL